MELKQVQVGYVNALLEIEDLALHHGKTYALVGANGKGKTTFLKTIVGSLPARKGHVFLNNERLSDMSLNEIARNISFVASKTEGVPYLSCNEFVGLGRTPHTLSLGRLGLEDIRMVDRSFERLGISHLKNKAMMEISDGERQLLAVAKAYAQNTQYLILDEPTAFLDYNNKLRMMGILNELASEENKCVVFSSHDLELTLSHSNFLLCLPSQEQKILKVSTERLDFQSLIQLCFK